MQMIIENMFFIGIYMSMAALCCVIIGLTLTQTYPVGVFNGRPTLPVKWFIVAGLLFLASISWIIGGMII